MNQPNSLCSKTEVTWCQGLGVAFSGALEEQPGVLVNQRGRMEPKAEQRGEMHGAPFSGFLTGGFWVLRAVCALVTPAGASLGSVGSSCSHQEAQLRHLHVITVVAYANGIRPSIRSFPFTCFRVTRCRFICSQLTLTLNVSCKRLCVGKGYSLLFKWNVSLDNKYLPSSRTGEGRVHSRRAKSYHKNL